MNLLDKVFKGRVQRREVEEQVRANSQRIRAKTVECGEAAEEALAIIAAGEKALLEKGRAEPGLEATADLPRAPVVPKQDQE